jgi:hypothetical protein
MVYVGCVFGVKILGKDKDILWYVTLVRMRRVGGDVTALCGLSMACARVNKLQKVRRIAFLEREPQPLLRLIGNLREGEQTLAQPKKAIEFAFLEREPQPLLRLAVTLREG